MRKRPRLGSIDDAGENMSDDILTTPTRITTNTRYVNLSVAKEMLTVESIPPPSSPAEPSVTTLNLRPSATGDALVEQTPNSQVHSDTQLLPENRSRSGSGVSSDRSPVIEIDEPEDVDDDYPQVTGFGAAAASVEEELYDQFPLADRLRPSQAVKAVSEEFLKTHHVDYAMLDPVTEWLARWLNYTTPRRSRWVTIYVEDAEFWNNLAALYNKVIHREATEIMRRYRDRTERAMKGVLIYFRLCTQLMTVDIELLQHTAVEPLRPFELCSLRHVRNVEALANPDAPFWSNLREMSQVESIVLVRDLIQSALLEDCDIFSIGARLSTMLLQSVSKTQKSNAALFHCTKTFAHAHLHILTVEALGTDANIIARNLQKLNREGFNLVKEAEEQLKKATTLSPEACVEIVCSISDLLLVIAKHDPRLTASLPSKIPAEPGSDEYARMIQYDFTLRLLWHLVVKSKMELRVAAIQALGKQLIWVWRQSTRSEAVPTDHVVQFVAGLLIELDVVKYIVSADSHPQISGRSGDVLGLIAITHRWTPEMTDQVWTAVKSNSDPRAVTAILECLKTVTKLCEKEEAMRLGRNVLDLPTAALTPQLLDFFLSLVGDNTKDGFSTSVEAIRAKQNLCLEFVQRLAPHEEFFHWVDRGLALLSVLERVAPDVSHRQEMYEACIGSIKSRSHLSHGSLHAIRQLTFEQNKEWRMLLQEYGFAQILADDICNFAATKTPNFLLGLELRLVLLSNVLLGDPSMLSEETQMRILDHLVGENAINPVAQDHAWHYLVAKIVKACRVENEFVRRFMFDFLPQLPPKHYRMGIRDMLLAVAEYRRRVQPLESPGENEVCHIPYEDIFWHLINSAPDRTIENDTIRLLSQQYIHGETLQMRTSCVAATHATLVERCITQLTEAAAVISENQESVQGHDEVFSAAERRFTRTLYFLTQFLADVKSRPQLQDKSEMVQASPRSRFSSPEDSSEVYHLKYQAFSPGLQKEIQELKISANTTFAELDVKLRHATGFDKISCLNSGRPLDLSQEPDRVVADLSGLVIVRDVSNNQTTSGYPQVNSGKTVAERTILTHLNTFCEFLTLPEGLSGPVCDFLTDFPPHGNILDLVLAEPQNLAELLPEKHQYKTQYSLTCLKQHLAVQLKTGTMHEKFIFAAIQALTSQIIQTETFNRSDLHIVDCLLPFLREKPVSGTSAAYFADPPRLTERLVSMLQFAMENPRTQFAHFSPSIYGALMECFLHDNRIWQAFKAQENQQRLHYLLLCKNFNFDTQFHIRHIIEIPLHVDALTTPKTEFASYYWDLLSPLISQLCAVDADVLERRHCVILVDTMANVFAAYERLDDDEILLRRLMEEWTEHIATYKPQVVSDQLHEPDYVFYGLCKLLDQCVLKLKSFKHPIDNKRLFEVLWNKYLFPPVDDDMRDSNSDTSNLVLDSDIRRILYNLVFQLCEDDKILPGLMKQMSEILEVNERADRIPFNTQRSIWLRHAASFGYGGLRNLTNTCYMNSLMTQLFMNEGFRNFVLGLDLSAVGQPPKLLGETQQLFAQMQHSNSKYADTAAFTGAIKPYDSDHIDISIQMDVDEFYNLLFDRWESQLASQDKAQFRSYYGGELVTQIKSKDCEHVSERMEPFQAIQCEVRGKQGLLDSLRAYVEGDVMEGDNKYKCESCGGRFVDAVKRSCLKQVPDNVIFHLKRFDFDLTTMERSKINDRFEFPWIMDLSEYKVEHLNDPDQEIQRDEFELVGVLVHTGTAETGHYYSYARVPPRPGSDEPMRWIEFNDTEVTEFDSQKVPDACFGGLYDNSSIPIVKTHSAYMLFYRRRTALVMDFQKASDHHDRGEVEEIVPPQLKERIAKTNNAILRQYCLFDDNHTGFLMRLLKLVRKSSDGACSESHDLEKTTIDVCVKHMHQILFRMKDTVELDAFVLAFRQFTCSCSICCAVALESICARRDIMGDLLFVCPLSKLRQTWIGLVTSLLQDLKRLNKELYCPPLDETNPASMLAASINDSILAQVVASVLVHFDSLGRYTRSWDDYFHILYVIAIMGHSEAGLLLRDEVLTDCMGLITRENPMEHIGGERYNNVNRTLQNASLRRQPGMTSLLKVFYTLLSNCDPWAPAVDSGRLRMERYDKSTGRFPLNRLERILLELPKEKSDDLVIDLFNNLLSLDTDEKEPWLAAHILDYLLEREAPARFEERLASTICNEFSDRYPDGARPGFQAAKIFCHGCRNLEHPRQILLAASDNTQSIKEKPKFARRAHGRVIEYQSQDGQAHLNFYEELAALSNTKTALPEKHPFQIHVVQTSPVWAPVLLYYETRKTKELTAAFLQELIFNKFPLDLGDMKDEDASSDDLQLHCERSEAVRNIYIQCSQIMDRAEKAKMPRTWVHEIFSVASSCNTWLDQLANQGGKEFDGMRNEKDFKLLTHFNKLKALYNNWPPGADDVVGSNSGVYSTESSSSETDPGY